MSRDVKWCPEAGLRQELRSSTMTLGEPTYSVPCVSCHPEVVAAVVPTAHRHPSVHTARTHQSDAGTRQGPSPGTVKFRTVTNVRANSTQSNFKHIESPEQSDQSARCIGSDYRCNACCTGNRYLDDSSGNDGRRCNRGPGRHTGAQRLAWAGRLATGHTSATWR